jgi:hypothetical protein
MGFYHFYMSSQSCSAPIPRPELHSLPSHGPTSLKKFVTEEAACMSSFNRLFSWNSTATATASNSLSHSRSVYSWPRSSSSRDPQTLRGIDVGSGTTEGMKGLCLDKDGPFSCKPRRRVLNIAIAEIFGCGKGGVECSSSSRAALELVVDVLCTATGNGSS